MHIILLILILINIRLVCVSWTRMIYTLREANRIKVYSNLKDGSVSKNAALNILKSVLLGIVITHLWLSEFTIAIFMLALLLNIVTLKIELNTVEK